MALKHFGLVSTSLFLGLFIGSQSWGEVVKYEVTLEANWTPETHPVDYPEVNPHFSTHIGATHNSDYTLWGPGQLATVGMKDLAERGVPGAAREEVEAAIEAGTADRWFQVNPPPPQGSKSQEVRVSSSHHLISMATMIAPSPDWFIGFHDVNLQAGGDWISEITLDAHPYDSGTDDGTTYRSPDEASEPFTSIFQITDGILEGTPEFGVYTISLASVPGDVDENGTVDAKDISTICGNLGSADERFEYTGDSMITAADVHAMVETRLNTRPGDTNLDGNVNFDDFLALSANFGKDFRDWARGDFDCNQTVDFPDFLLMSRHFGFSAEAEAAGIAETATVPEPTGCAMLSVLLCGLATLRKRRQLS